METNNQIFGRYQKEYWKSKAKRDKKAQTRILDAVTEVVQMNRKAAIRKFARLQKKDSAVREKRGRPRRYTPDVLAALKDVWEASNRLCGELLFPIVREYVSILRNDGMWANSSATTDKLLGMSLGAMKVKVGAFRKMRRKGRGVLFDIAFASQAYHPGLFGSVGQRTAR